MDFQYGSFFKLYLAHISRVRNCGDHVLLCFPLTRNVVCTVGLCPAYIAAPTQGSLLMCIKRASLWPSWRLPEAISGLCHPNVFIVAETQLESPELENREEIHVFFLFKLFNSKGWCVSRSVFYKSVEWTLLLMGKGVGFFWNMEVVLCPAK